MFEYCAWHGYGVEYDTPLEFMSYNNLRIPHHHEDIAIHGVELTEVGMNEYICDGIVL
jgi:hypothetical protein